VLFDGSPFLTGTSLTIDYMVRWYVEVSKQLPNFFRNLAPPVSNASGAALNAPAPIRDYFARLELASVLR
jgi:hypothetical protein